MSNGTILLNKHLAAGLLMALSLALPRTSYAQDAILGEVRLFAVIYCPDRWMDADGRTLQIANNPALYSLLGTRFGGDGRQTFGLPDLRGRVAIGAGYTPGLSQYEMGQTGGSESVTLTIEEMPAHSHSIRASTKTGTSSASVAAGADGEVEVLTEPVQSTGMSQPHENMPPYQVLRYCICMDGEYPRRP